MTLLFGSAYDVVIAPVEAMGLRAERARVVAPAVGRVLEVGAGTGLGLHHYPPAVTAVVACEPDPAMRGRLATRAKAAPVPVTVLEQGVPGLDLPDGSFDTIVCVLVLCTVPDPAAALAELRRLLAPGGVLLFLEHVLGRGPVARLQRAAAPAWARAAGGCRLDRDTIGALRAAGFVVTDLERLAPLGRLTGGSVVRGRAIARLPTETETHG
ncbi:MAG: hypothetical protein NVSMB12_10870 [Acidimicrobiales bacterium]